MLIPLIRRAFGWGKTVIAPSGGSKYYPATPDAFIDIHETFPLHIVLSTQTKHAEPLHLILSESVTGIHALHLRLSEAIQHLSAAHVRLSEAVKHTQLIHYAEPVKVRYLRFLTILDFMD